MSLFHHPRIIELEAVIIEQTNMGIVMEYMDLGDLLVYVQNEQNNIDWNTKIRWALEIADGMRYMHSFEPPVIHRDLKSPNILLKREGSEITTKISDFGLTRTLALITNFKKKSCR